MTPERVLVGAIAGSFGVQGEVRLKSFCAVPEAIAGYGPLYTEDGTRQFRIKLTKAVSGGLGARLSGIATKEEADTLRGTSLYADKDKLPSLPDDEYYHADLIGLAVMDPGGAQIGTIVAVHNHGAGDLLEVRPAGVADTSLVPFTRAIVPLVDLAAKLVIVDLPEGLD
jgi:16S rRNA processing protein RimM